MIVGKPLPFVNDYVHQLSAAMSSGRTHAGMTEGRKRWLSFGLMCIMVTHSICWRQFARLSLGAVSDALLSWYFRRPMSWGLLLSASVNLVLAKFTITEGILVIDDTGKKRSKTTTRIPYVHFFKSKEGTGSLKGQEIVLLVLVTSSLTIPVGYEFYQPDPAYTKWSRLHSRLKRQGIPASQRPSRPAPNPDYPTKSEIALTLRSQLANDCPFVKIKAVLADALYGNASFMQQAHQRFTPTQVVSQLRHHQKIYYRGRTWHLDEYFQAYPGTSQSICVRGADPTEVLVGSARLYVEAQQRKCFVIALRYPNETHNRYLVATDLSWRTLDIVQVYTLRWLVEVTIEDLKVYEGWGQATKQPDDEGSRRGLTLSLLCDHCLLLHPEQQVRIAQRQPLYTIGSLQRHLQLESLLTWLNDWLDDPQLVIKLEQLTEVIRPLFLLQPSKKHLSGQTLGRLEPTPALKYRALAPVQATT